MNVAPRLHELPVGSIVQCVEGSLPGLVALKWPTAEGPARPWTVTGEGRAFTVGELLAMSQDWVVIREGDPS